MKGHRLGKKLAHTTKKIIIILDITILAYKEVPSLYLAKISLTLEYDGTTQPLLIASLMFLATSVIQVSNNNNEDTQVNLACINHSP